jgi:putative beta-lysine N-acetyltransferase
MCIDITFDKIETFNNSLIQHGKYNDRVYVMKLSRNDFPYIINYIDELIDKYSYSKIFVKAPAWSYKDFVNNGFVKEAFIPNFFNGYDDCYFLCKYLDESRKKIKPSIKKKISEVKEKADKIKNSQYLMISKYLDKIKIINEDRINDLIKLYKNVFLTYPFPIFDKDFIKNEMEKGTKYYGIYNDGKLIAASSSEINYKDSNVEMTDFATLGEYRGNSLSYYLLNKMECDIKKSKIKTAYTIARSLSYGMNITFSKLGYNLAGTLFNNTNISGDFENMNVYYKNF